MVTEGLPIEDIQGLDALPDYAVVMGAPSGWGSDKRPQPFEKFRGKWNVPGVEEDIESAAIPLPAKVIYLPED